MLISSLEQFLACAGCSSNVPYCSSPLCCSALMLLCQLLKSDKLSIFSIASQKKKKAANSLATKLLISMVSPSSCAVFKWTDVPPVLPSVPPSASCFIPSVFLSPFLQPRHSKTLGSGNQAALFAGASSQIQHETPSQEVSWRPTGSLHNEFVCDC